MKIGIDLDEVLADFLPALIMFHNHTYGTTLKREEFKSYRFWEIWGGTKEEAIKKVFDFYKTHYFQKIKPVSGSQEAVNELKKKDNDLFVITSRQYEITRETLDWIKKYFPNIFTDIYFTNHYSSKGKSLTKSKISNLLAIDILIEDSYEYALQCLDLNRKIFLINCPWNNKARLPKGICRVYNWEEILYKCK